LRWNSADCPLTFCAAHFIEGGWLVPTLSASRPLTILLILVLAVLSAIYIRHGALLLVEPNSRSQAMDLQTNWRELHVIAHRGSPYAPPAVPFASPYPPYAFLVNGLFYWPTWPAAKFYFCGIILACVLLCATWAWQSDPSADLAQRWLLFFAVVGCNVVSTILGLGQNTTIYVVALVACLLLIQKDQQILAGIALAIAASKINIAGPFFLPLLFAKKWKALAAAIVYMLVGWALVCWWIHASPVAVFHTWVTAAQRNVGYGYDFSLLLKPLGLPPPLLTKVTALIVFAAAAVVLYAKRGASWQGQFAIASVAGRLWAYHRLYDNFMLIFLVVTLLSLWFSRRLSALALAVTAGICVVFWIPPRMIDKPPVLVASVLLWAAGAAVVAIYDANRPGMKPDLTDPARASLTQPASGESPG
jgi:hypothetical protein